MVAMFVSPLAPVNDEDVRALLDRGPPIGSQLKYCTRYIKPRGKGDSVKQAPLCTQSFPPGC